MFKLTYFIMWKLEISYASGITSSCQELFQTNLICVWGKNKKQKKTKYKLKTWAKGFRKKEKIIMLNGEKIRNRQKIMVKI